MKSLRRLALVAFLCVVAIGYLYMHNLSLRLTRQQAELETQARLFSQRLARAQAEVMKLGGFARLDSVWTSAGRPGLDSGPGRLAFTPPPDSSGRARPDSAVAVVPGRGVPVGN